MANPLAGMMSSLSIAPAPSPPRTASAVGSSSTSTAASTNKPPRLGGVMTKYMNPDFVRPANKGLTSRAADGSGVDPSAARAPLFKIAGLNTTIPSDVPSSTAQTKPSSGHTPKKHALTQHTAHGIHGPAHSTTGRAMAPSIQARAGLTSNGGIGKYDGGLEKDWEARDAPTGDAAKSLDLDSMASR
jgi:aurora kinase